MTQKFRKTTQEIVRDTDVADTAAQPGHIRAGILARGCRQFKTLFADHGSQLGVNPRVMGQDPVHRLKQGFARHLDA